MIYLDNAATSYPKPDRVYEAVARTMREVGGNAGRGSHRHASGAEKRIRESRATVAGFFGISDPSRLVFACNATDALNMAIKGTIGHDDRVVTTCLEHNSVLRPLAGLETRLNISVTYVPVGKNGYVEPANFQKALETPARLVVLNHASNVLGTVQPLAEISAICRSHEVPLLVDAAQSAGKVPIDVMSPVIDMLAFSGHKSLLGPQGTGCLYIREGIEIDPWREGGTGTKSEESKQPAEMPNRLEAGTQNLPAIVGLAEGIRYIEDQGCELIHQRGMALIFRLVEALSADDQFILYGEVNTKNHVPTLSLNIRRRDPGEVGMILDQAFGIAVRTGLHCAAPVHKALGTAPAGTVRISPGPFTTEQDIDALVDALEQIADDGNNTRRSG
jgi:cysteine desulfurase/selenocysteine lyase